VRDLILILGDQLFQGLPGMPPAPVWMAEDRYLCTRIRHHQQKLVLFLSAMRHFARELEHVQYTPLDMQFEGTIFDRLSAFLRDQGVERLHAYEVADRFFAARLSGLCEATGVQLVVHPNPMFLTQEPDWQTYRSGHRRLFMADFYKWQRRRLGILLDNRRQPLGGKWSFDEDNRKALPKGIDVPEPWYAEPDAITREVIQLVERCFSSHPGRAADFRYPVTHADAAEWLEQFVSQRLDQFGDYEDALSREHRVVFHGLLTPFLNTGLLTPQQVIGAALSKPGVPINSQEGFIRQVIGWREFVRGIDREYGQGKTPENALGHHRTLAPCWYDGSTGLPPLDTVIHRARDHAYCHHIERLMVAGAAMVMCEVDPAAAYRWFMEMFLDSADWVMGPNVFGMSQFADGGLFATKPYVSGSGYLRRMGDYPPGEWCEVWDGLFWRFVGRQRELFASNPRTSVMVRSLDALPHDRKARILDKAEEFIGRTTLAPRCPAHAAGAATG